jgi:putative nucleotidyltransferase with HDIG domain
MRYPTEQQALELLGKYRLPKEIVEHSKRVEAVAVKIAKQIKAAGNDVDLELVKSATILHDIGKWKYLRNKKEIHYMHAYETGRLLRKLGWPEFASVCESHFEVTKEYAKRLGHPEPHDTFPKTVEAKILQIADNIRPDRKNLEEIIEYLQNSKKAEKRYWAQCPGLKEMVIKDVTRTWHELEKLGMRM